MEALFADIAPARMSADLPETGGPVVTFRGLEPLAQPNARMAALAYGGASGDGEEEEEGGWKGLLGSIGAAISGGGHCPSPSSGPLILR